jgi:hypothetical protein
MTRYQPAPTEYPGRETTGPSIYQNTSLADRAVAALK